MRCAWLPDGISLFKKPNFDTLWKALELKMSVYYMIICYI
jgi:hypothetical protein